MVYLSNAFSLQMQGEYQGEYSVTRSDGEEVRELVWNRVFGEFIATSCIRNTSVAAAMSQALLIDVPATDDRRDVYLHPGDTLVVGYLPEGCSYMEWYLVECHKSSGIIE